MGEPVFSTKMYHPNGQILFEGNLINRELKHGPCKSWYSNGQLNWSANYLFDKTDGKLVCYDSLGNKSVESFLINGKENGVRKEWGEDYYTEGEFKDDLMDGYARQINYFESGEIRYDIYGQFEEGVKLGLWTTLLANGDTLYKEYFNEGVEDSHYVYKQNKPLKFYSYGQDSLYVIYLYEDQYLKRKIIRSRGQLKQVNYYQPNGLFTQKRIFLNDSVERTQYFDSLGVLVKEKKFVNDQQVD